MSEDRGEEERQLERLRRNQQEDYERNKLQKQRRYENAKTVGDVRKQMMEQDQLRRIQQAEANEEWKEMLRKRLEEQENKKKDTE
jgi:hypothetical protein